ncbi:GNAT family N-acetyltransferase [Tenacibaculum aquimarinum]|uniref:GNAT family N-acetyltransferase n=1 Tax=Tenacibaculum aquimarinum TaxID=2910675 RepID=UPI001F0AE8D8|nr:GNAT family N-acetyltransferase [Tenacibaculum aquimarinum]MCH3883557.1 GNAT family N-acetyltransferase [Tenacibaculum aquimarinum]
MKFYLETERLILREIKETDLDGIFALDANPKVHLYLGNRPISSKKQALENIQFIQEQYRKRGIGRFACIEKATGEFIGWSGLKFNKGEKEAVNGIQNFIDIGYRFIPKYWKKGYGFESATACLEFGFNQMNYNIINAAALEGNIGSNKILTKIGLQLVSKFSYEDVKANWYELKKEDYGN